MQYIDNSNIRKIKLIFAKKLIGSHIIEYTTYATSELSQERKATKNELARMISKLKKDGYEKNKYGQTIGSALGSKA